MLAGKTPRRDPIPQMAPAAGPAGSLPDAGHRGAGLRHVRTATI